VCHDLLKWGLGGDGFDFNFGKMLAVAVQLTVAFAAFLLEDQHFVILQVL
jgi:hypothetical protein